MRMAASMGSLENLRISWCDEISSQGPYYGYLQMLLVKDEFWDAATELFELKSQLKGDLT